MNMAISGTFLDKVLRIAQLGSVITLIFVIGVTYGRSQDRMFDSAEQKTETINHTDSSHPNYKDVHMTLAEKQDEFVTRREYKLLLKGQDEIKQALRDLNKK